MIFAWGGERGFFIMFLVIGQPNGPLQKKMKERKKNHQNICALGCTTTNLINSYESQ
jgi:hypothetical protein